MYKILLNTVYPINTAVLLSSDKISSGNVVYSMCIDGFKYNQLCIADVFDRMYIVEFRTIYKLRKLYYANASS